MFRTLLDRLKTISLWHLLWISVVLSEVFTGIMNATMGLLWWGRIDRDLMIIGSIDAFVVALFVTAILIFLFLGVRAHERSADEAIRRAKDEWERTFNSMTDLIMIVDRDHRIVKINKAMADKLKMTSSLAEGIICYEHVHGTTKPPAFCPHNMAIHDAKEHSAEVYEERLGGTYLISVNPLFNEQGEVTGSVHTARDISAQRRQEQALRENERFLQTVIDTEPECIKLLAADGSLIQMNRAGLAMIEADSLDQVKGQSLYGLVAEDYREAFRIITEQVFKGKPGRLEFQVQGLKGRRLWLETNAVPLRNDKDEIIALLGITRDITERKQAESALRKATEEKDLLIDNLQQALATIRTLRGILPICSSCKKIRDDNGAWNQLEYYIREHSGADFSHGLCPECAKKLYPDYYDKKGE